MAEIRRGKQVLRVVVQRGYAADGVAGLIGYGNACCAAAGDDGCCEILVDRAAGRGWNVARDAGVVHVYAAILVVGVMRLNDEGEHVVPVDPVAQH